MADIRMNAHLSDPTASAAADARGIDRPQYAMVWIEQANPGEAVDVVSWPTAFAALNRTDWHEGLVLCRVRDGIVVGRE